METSAEKQESLPHWPEIFTKRRYFWREAENEPYIHFVQSTWFEGEEDEQDEEDSDDDENENEANDDGEVNTEEENVSSEQENRDEGHTSNTRTDDQDPVDEDDLKPSDGPSKVRLFMRGLSGEEDDLHHRDQIHEFAKICEQANSEPHVAAKVNKYVALLDDRNILGIVLTNKGSSPPGNCRPYLGPLTAEMLGKELKKKRFSIASDQSETLGAGGDVEADAERRVLFITNLDPSTIEVLILTVSRTQAPAMKDLLYKHLTRQSSIGVTIPFVGFVQFTLDFHLPYYVLKLGAVRCEDERKNSDGNPLRQSWELPFLSNSVQGSDSTEMVNCLYEAQVSVAVTGIDHWVWTAYCIIDTYYGSEESVDGYDQMKGRVRRRWERPDPLAAGRIVAGEPIWTPREYFLKVVKIRTYLVLREWRSIADKVEKEVKQSQTRADTSFPLSSDGPKTRQQVRDSICWNHHMVKLLRRLLSGLFDTIQAWDQFAEKEIGYLRCPRDPRNALASPLDAIEKAFREMKKLHKKLENLRKELCEENPQGFNAQLCLENNDSTILQQGIAKNNQVLSIVMLLFFPLSLASNLFSTTGILPSHRTNLSYFIHVTLILAVLMMAVYVFLNILLNWSWCFEQTAVLLGDVWNATSFYVERPAKTETSTDADDTQRSWKWRMRIWRRRKAVNWPSRLQPMHLLTCFREACSRFGKQAKKSTGADVSNAPKLSKWALPIRRWRKVDNDIELANLRNCGCKDGVTLHNNVGLDCHSHVDRSVTAAAT